MSADAERRHALLLSGSLGLGHDVMAAACAHSLEARGWTTETLDAMQLLTSTGSRVGQAVFRSIFAVPGLYDAFHFNALRTGKGIARYLDRQSRQLVVPRLRKHMASCRPDLLVSVFATAASAVGVIKAEFPGVRTMTFCTDANPYAMWV